MYLCKFTTKGHPSTEYVIPTKYKKKLFTSSHQYSGLSITKNTEVFLLIILSLFFFFFEGFTYLFPSFSLMLYPTFDSLFNCYGTSRPLQKIMEHNKYKFALIN